MVQTWCCLGQDGTAGAIDVEDRRLYVLPRRLLRDEGVPRGLDQDVVQLQLFPPSRSLLKLPTHKEECSKTGRREWQKSRVCNDHEVDQNLATDFFADFPTELPTMATMVTMLAVLDYGYILTDDQ